MIWLVVSLVIILLIVCIILQMKIKHSREQEAEGKQLLEDYQKRVNEMEKLLKDYRSLEQNFDNVGRWTGLRRGPDGFRQDGRGEAESAEG